MPTMIRDSNVRQFTNGGTALVCGDLVQLPDAVVGLVTAARGVGANEVGVCDIDCQVIVTKTNLTDVIAAGARIAYHPTTKSGIAQVGAATAPAFIIGRAVAAAGNGVPTVTVALNHQGPSI